MLHSVKINGEWMDEVYGLILLADLSIEAPERKTNYIDIIGADGVIDVSNYPLGRPTYNRRQVKFNLFKGVNDVELRQIRADLMNKYHGKEVEVVLPDDTTHCFKGIFSCGEQSGYGMGTINIIIDAEPYRYKVDETVVTANLSSTAQEIVLPNEAMIIVPVITAENEANLILNGNSYTVSAGTHKMLGFQLLQGANTVSATGNGAIEFRYREASF